MPGPPVAGTRKPSRGPLAALLVALAALHPDAGALHASPDSLRVEFVPRSARTGTKVEVVLRNGSTLPLTRLRLRWVAPEGVTGTLSPDSIPTLPAGGEAVVEGRFTGPLLERDTAYLRVESTSSAGGPRVSFVALPLLPPRGVAPDSFLAVQVATSLESITDFSQVRINLLVTNRAAVPVTVLAVKPVVPRFLRTGSAGAFRLPPGASRVVPLDAEAVGRISPGKHLLLFEVPFEAQGAREPLRGVVFASREVRVAVLGESEVLQALALPSFLLAPGFLALVALTILWKIPSLRSWRPAADLPFEFPKPEFWVLAVTLSLAIWVVETRVRDPYYLTTYGAADVAVVWSTSLGVGVALFALAVAYRHWERRQNRPLPVLRRLEELDDQLVRPVVKFTLGGSEATALLVDDREGPADWVLVSPFVGVEWKALPPGDLRQKVFDELRKEVLNPRGTVRGLVAQLEQAEKVGVRVEWKAWKGIGSPLRIPKSSVTRWDARKEHLIWLPEYLLWPRK